MNCFTPFGLIAIKKFLTRCLFNDKLNNHEKIALLFFK